jgi:hypothetical protein
VHSPAPSRPHQWVDLVKKRKATRCLDTSSLETSDAFFAAYVASFNRSLGSEVDVDGMRAYFSECFIGAGPDGVRCGENNTDFGDVLVQGYAFYRSIGTRRMVVRAITTTPIDETHQMARVDYRATYATPSGEMVTIDFAVTDFLTARDQTFTIFGFVAGDERALFRQHGLLGDA